MLSYQFLQGWNQNLKFKYVLWWVDVPRKRLEWFLSAFLFGLFAVWGRMRRIQWTWFCIVAPGYWLMASLTIAFTICLANPGSKGFEIYSSKTRASVYQQLPKSITCIPPHIPPYTTNIPPYTTPHTTVYHPTYHRIPQGYPSLGMHHVQSVSCLLYYCTVFLFQIKLIAVITAFYFSQS